ncbi:protoporphyrinogen oxidase [Ferviditalea candida]|uniref:Coproporphyrinogen III oxidase n=1 Tax=Ferviditalea candida TaxID=3108399 RepID=A0ABU5ZD06_9BACL|nr:protoporphyrinogen oxidase [Paenibacillaceae bacterium T2]
MKVRKVLIAGGGISGLSSAFYAKQLLGKHGIPAEITIVEEANKPGGKIQTIRRDGFVIERGPDSFLARKLPILELARELGLEGELAGTNPAARKTFILHRGKLHSMPAGLVLGIPTQLMPFIKTGLVSLKGKARAAMDLFLPKRREQGDESLGDFLQRRLGKEVLEHIAEPLLAGIYAGDTHSLSLRSTFPQFQELERRYRSIMLGMLKSRGRSNPDGQSPKLRPEISNSMFLTFRNGLQTLVEALVESMAPHQILTDTRIVSIRKSEGKEKYAAVLSDGRELEVDAVIVALPAFAAADVLRSFSAAEALREIPYVSVANVILAFEKEQIHYPLDGSGFVIPRSEGRLLTACTWTSAKWLHTAPEGKAVLRCYIGRSGDELSEDMDDEQLLSKVRAEIREIMNIEAEPLFAEVTRWKQSMPQYPVGHLERLGRVREALECEAPGIVLTGSGYEGVGLPDCIRQGKDAAIAAVDRLLKRNAPEQPAVR